MSTSGPVYLRLRQRRAAELVEERADGIATRDGEKGTVLVDEEHREVAVVVAYDPGAEPIAALSVLELRDDGGTQSAGRRVRDALARYVVGG